MYEPLLSYVKFGIVENPTSVSKTFQALGYLDLETSKVIVFNDDGKLFLTYGLNIIGSTTSLFPPP